MTWPAYYNEWEPYCAAWLRNLIAAGHIPAGDVDERGIREVSGDDLRGYGQVHFFAGIGGWGYAARLASIPDDFPLWTGSCPCQPLSSAGQRKGHADERHLWPAFHALIAERQPAIVFGEQVASKLGREWLAGVRADLESVGYAVGAADLPAAGVGAPHIRQRVWWVAYATNPKHTQSRDSKGPGKGAQIQFGRGGSNGGLALANGWDASTERLQRGGQHRQQPQDGGSGGGLDNPASEQMGRARQPWQDCSWLPYADGKARRIGSGIQPLAHGIPARVGKLRAAGNAIVPQVGAQFMTAALHYLEAS